MHHSHPSLIVVLINLRSAYNVGSIFRTGESAGLTRLILTGYTPTPIEPKLQKTALGAIDHLPWIHLCDLKSTVSYLKKSRYSLIACETSDRARPVFSFSFPARTCLFFGNEITGLPSSLVQTAASVIKIPHYGHKESLNVAAAAGIMIYSWRRQYP